jgi:hypothetical protein
MRLTTLNLSFAEITLLHRLVWEGSASPDELVQFEAVLAELRTEVVAAGMLTPSGARCRPITTLWRMLERHHMDTAPAVARRQVQMDDNGHVWA